MKNILLIVQARLGSTRLPKKVLKPLLGRPLIAHLLERLKALKTPHKLLLATTKKVEDMRLARYVQALGLPVFRGESDHVLDRYYQAAKSFSGDIIVRITGDCPLVQPSLLDEMLQHFLTSSPDYLSNVHPRTYPKGFDLEIFTFQALEKAWTLARNAHEKEHVTPYLLNHPNQFVIQNKKAKEDYSHLNVSVDTEEDFYWVEKLFKKYYQSNPLFGLQELLEFAENEPHFAKRMVSGAT